jgi:hypothetical protein
MGLCAIHLRQHNEGNPPERRARVPRQPKAPDGTPAEQQAEQRQRIMKADPIGFLLDVMAGKPLPVLGVDGEIVSWERVDAVGRAAAADRLLKRVLPELKAVEMTTGEGGVTFTLTAPFAVPCSARPAHLPNDTLQRSLRLLAAAATEEEQTDD